MATKQELRLLLDEFYAPCFVAEYNPQDPSGLTIRLELYRSATKETIERMWNAVGIDGYFVAALKSLARDVVEICQNDPEILGGLKMIEMNYAYTFADVNALARINRDLAIFSDKMRAMGKMHDVITPSSKLAEKGYNLFD